VQYLMIVQCILYRNEKEYGVRRDLTMPIRVRCVEKKAEDRTYTRVTEERRMLRFGYRRFRLWPWCHTVSKADRSTCRSTRFEARPKASCIAIRRESYRLCFKDVIESRKQIRNDAEGIAGRGFRP